MAVLNMSARTAPDLRDAATFSGAPALLLISGPTVLYRLVGTWRDTLSGKKQRSNPSGVFWFGKTVIDMLREDFREATLSGERVRDPGQNIMNAVRDGLAVSYEWNSFDTLIEMTVPAAAQVRAWSGMTVWQLEYQRRTTGRLLDGGFVQYLVYDVDTMPPGIMRRHALGELWRRFSQKLPASPIRNRH